MTNCKNCGAPIDKSGVCSYCGTVYSVKFIDKPTSNRNNNFSTYNTVRQLNIKTATVLPMASESTMGYMYLVAETNIARRVYVEYITVKTGNTEPYTYSWERVGIIDNLFANCSSVFGYATRQAIKSIA